MPTRIVSEIGALDDDLLTAYLFGMAVACPLGLPGTACPLLVLQQDDLATVLDALLKLTRQQKIELVGRHLACSELHERSATVVAGQPTSRLPTLSYRPGESGNSSRNNR